MEAIEALLTQQHKPQRTVYVAYGHDEELQGNLGAMHIANQLKVHIFLIIWLDK